MSVDLGPNRERNSLIASIVNQNRRSFEEWRTHPVQARLDVPLPVLSFLTPPRLYELVEKPEKVEMITPLSRVNNVEFVITEPRVGLPGLFF